MNFILVGLQLLCLILYGAAFFGPKSEVLPPPAVICELEDGSHTCELLTSKGGSLELSKPKPVSTRPLI